MSSPYTGGCACGALRYVIADQPIAEVHCQCRDCQRRSGTGHGSYLAFADRARAEITGEAASWRLAGDSGSDKFHAFCPTCGTPVHLTFAAAPIIAVHAASLDEPERFQPSAVTYSVRALDWDAVDPRLVRFDRMPPG